MRIIRATGAVADALRRYDRNLDVRYSWERRMWAITFRTRRPDLLPVPVTHVGTLAGVVEERMAELSEAHISYRTKTYPAAYVGKLSWDAFERIVRSDTTKVGVGRALKDIAGKRQIEQYKQSKERWKEARSYMNWHARNNIMAD